jgi:hypothetical protein
LLGGEKQVFSVDWVAWVLAELVQERGGICRDMMQSRDHAKCLESWIKVSLNK